LSLRFDFTQRQQRWQRRKVFIAESDLVSRGARNGAAIAKKTAAPLLRSPDSYRDEKY